MTELMRCITASTSPHAMLQPIRPMSSVGTSSRSAVAAARTCERQRHDDAEEDLGRARKRIEHAFGSSAAV